MNKKPTTTKSANSEPAENDYSITRMNDWIRSGKLSEKEVALLAALQANAGKTTYTTNTGITRLATYINVSYSTVERRLKALADKNIITVHHKNGVTNRYTINKLTSDTAMTALSKLSGTAVKTDSDRCQNEDGPLSKLSGTAVTAVTDYQLPKHIPKTTPTTNGTAEKRRSSSSSKRQGLKPDEDEVVSLETTGSDSDTLPTQPETAIDHPAPDTPAETTDKPTNKPTMKGEPTMKWDMSKTPDSLKKEWEKEMEEQFNSIPKNQKTEDEEISGNDFFDGFIVGDLKDYMEQIKYWKETDFETIVEKAINAGTIHALENAALAIQIYGRLNKPLERELFQRLGTAKYEIEKAIRESNRKNPLPTTEKSADDIKRESEHEMLSAHGAKARLERDEKITKAAADKTISNEEWWDMI